jgi:hypothetical protein
MGGDGVKSLRLRNAVTRGCLSIFDLRPSENGVAAADHLQKKVSQIYSDFLRPKILFGGKKRGKAGRSGKW